MLHQSLSLVPRQLLLQYCPVSTLQEVVKIQKILRLGNEENDSLVIYSPPLALEPSRALTVDYLEGSD